jgi:hypothetical protein
MLLAQTGNSAPIPVWQGYWIEVIAFAIAFGALGGVIGVFRDFDMAALMRGDKLYVQSRKRLGGAIAVLAILIVDGKFDVAPDDKARLTLCSLGTVAGFIGFTVLNSLARGLEKKIEQQDYRVNDLQRTVETNREQLEDPSVESAIALGFATANQAALGKETSEAISLSIWRLTAAIEKQPTNRTVGIILGRLYRWSNHYERAIDVRARSAPPRGNASRFKHRGAAL